MSTGKTSKSLKSGIQAQENQVLGLKEFIHLPAYADFLYQNKTREYSIESLRLARELDLPLLKSLPDFSDEQLIEMGEEGVKDMLAYFRESKFEEFINDSVNLWLSNQIPFISRNDIVIDDITTVNFMRRKILGGFLPSYTFDLEKAIKITEELDYFTHIQNNICLKLLSEMHDKLFVEAQQLSKIGNWIWDLKNDKLIWSDELYQIYDLDPGTEINRKDISLYNHPDDHDRVMEIMKKAREKLIPYDYYYRIVLPKSGIKHLHAKGNVKKGEEGAVEMYGTLQDVTEQKQTETALFEQQNFVQKIAEITPNLICAYAVADGDIIFLNGVVERILGYTVAEVKQRGINFLIQLVHPDDIDQLNSISEKAIEKANRQKKLTASDILFEHKYRIRHKDGHYCRFHSTGAVFRRNEKNEVEELLFVSIDITEQYRSLHELEEKHNELKRSEERYHMMVEEVQDYAIILLNKEGIIENWNSGATKIKGYSHSEAIGMSFKSFYTEEDRKKRVPDSLLKRAEKTGRAFSEGWRVRKDGTKFWASVVITALHDEKNNVIGFSKVTRDLTEKKKAEDKVKESNIQLVQKNEELERYNRELGSFSYAASHDLQEPLRKIQAFTKLLLEKESDNISDSGKDYMLRMDRAAARMRRLINDLLAFSRVTNTNNTGFEECNLNLCLLEAQNTLKLTIDEKAAHIRSEKLPQIMAIPFQIRQVFENLIGNSLKYSKIDVDPIIEVTYSKANGADFDTGVPEKNYHKIVFSDNGIGFANEDAKRIFELFQRLHGTGEYSGSGLGLAICKKILENHQGSIFANGRPGEGADFIIYLPLVSGQ